MMSKKKINTIKTYDALLMVLVFTLIIFGLLMIYSASAYTASLHMGSAFYYLKRQILTVLMGCCGMVIMAVSDYHKILKWSMPLYFLSILLLAAVFVIGTASHGQKRWIYIGSIGFQPSEFAKFVLILFLASMCSLACSTIRKWQGVVLIFLWIMPAAAMIMVTNLSTGIIVMGISFIMIFTASRQFGPFVILTGLGIGLMAVFLKLAAYRVDRIEAWLNVETHPKGYQTRQSLYAIGSGGVFGKGYGKSIQKLAYVPEAHNDMIFSIICEEWGLFGATIIVILFLLLLWRCIVIASRAKELAGALIVIGVAAHIGLQMMINIAVVTNSIPNTGIPLPFISYGGTSLIFLMCEIGLVQNVAHQGKIGIS
jgi:cell division protein FtsW